jgi:alpha-galactosidase
MTVKIAVVGGGSSMFVPGLVRRLLEIPCFEGAELRLMDVDARRVGVMEKLAIDLAEAEGRKLSVAATTDRSTALRGADFVIVAVSVGGMAAWATDIEIPAKHGVFMHIADSIGPGGIFRSLRNTPIVAAVARDLEELSPRALVLNYTNPASANVIAMSKSSSVRSLSLCSCSPYPYMDSWLTELVGVPADEIVKPSYVGGINHCTGIFSLKLKDGRDAMPIVRERTNDEITRWAIDTFGVIPYCWTHWIEFFPQLQRLEEPYKGRAQGLAMRYGRRIYDMELQKERMHLWERVAEQWSADAGPHHLADLPHGPEDNGIVVAEVIESVVDDRNERFIVNVMNAGLISNLPPQASVEVPAVVNAEGVHPLGIGSIPTGLAAILGCHALVEELTADAALSGDRELLRQAMMIDPLVGATLEIPAIEALIEEMLEVNRPYLPQFVR